MLPLYIPTWYLCNNHSAGTMSNISGGIPDQECKPGSLANLFSSVANFYTVTVYVMDILEVQHFYLPKYFFITSISA